MMQAGPGTPIHQNYNKLSPNRSRKNLEAFGLGFAQNFGPELVGGVPRPTLNFFLTHVWTQNSCFFEVLANKKYNATIMGPGPWRRQLGALGPMGPKWGPRGPRGPKILPILSHECRRCHNVEDATMSKMPQCRRCHKC